MRFISCLKFHLFEIWDHDFFIIWDIEWSTDDDCNCIERWKGNRDWIRMYNIQLRYDGSMIVPIRFIGLCVEYEYKREQW